jgi:hypothetical protein
MSELSTQIRDVRFQVSKEINAELSDADILRFLRARNLDLHATQKMIVDWHVWRHTPISEASTLTPATVLSRENFRDAKEPLYAILMPHSNLARDKAGRPIYYEKTGLISNRMDEILKKFTPDELIVRHVRQQELMMRVISFIYATPSMYLSIGTYIINCIHACVVRMNLFCSG